MASAMIPIAGHNAPKGSVKKRREKRYTKTDNNIRWYNKLLKKISKQY